MRLFMLRDIPIMALVLSVGSVLWSTIARGQDIYVTNENAVWGHENTGTIGQYTMSGTTLNASLFSGLNAPWGIAVSGSNVFVVNAGSKAIGEYTTSGATVNPSLVSGFQSPNSIAVSGTNLFVTDCVAGTIGEYTTSGAMVNRFAGLGVSGRGWHCRFGVEPVCHQWGRGHDWRIHHLGSNRERISGLGVA